MHCELPRRQPGASLHAASQSQVLGLVKHPTRVASALTCAGATVPASMPLFIPLSSGVDLRGHFISAAVLSSDPCSQYNRTVTLPRSSILHTPKQPRKVHQATIAAEKRGSDEQETPEERGESGEAKDQPSRSLEESKAPGEAGGNTGRQGQGHRGDKVGLKGRTRGEFHRQKTKRLRRPASHMVAGFQSEGDRMQEERQEVLN
jgi:hypothetical protein